jgi:hypothetical protein
VRRQKRGKNDDLWKRKRGCFVDEKIKFVISFILSPSSPQTHPTPYIIMNE